MSCTLFLSAVAFVEINTLVSILVLRCRQLLKVNFRMGIEGFESFCKKYTDKNFQSVTIRNEILVIDGSELLYQIYNACTGRAPFDQFREQTIKFYTNLRTCGIRPVVVFDGFKFESNHEKYIKKRVEIIRRMRQSIGRGEAKEPNKSHLCGTILEEVNQELGIPVVNGAGDTDSSTAAIANLLRAKVLASDTQYCVYNLSDGCLPTRYFKSNNDAEINKEKGIQAKLYHIESFSRQYHIPSNVVSYLDIFFGRNSCFPQKFFQSFVSLRFKNNGSYPQHLTNYFRWMADNYTTDDDLIKSIIASLGNRDDHLNIQGRLEERLASFRHPRISRRFRLKVREQVRDEEMSNLLLNNEHDAEEDENDELAETNLRENIPSFAHDILKKTPTGGDNPIRFLRVLMSKPEEPSPHNATRALRRQMYQLLVTGDNLVVVEYDRVEDDYTEVEEIRVRRQRNLNPALVEVYGNQEKNPEFIEFRKQHILSILVGDEDAVRQFEDSCSNISEELKLLLACGVYWIRNTAPGDTAISALAFTVSLIYLKSKDGGDRHRPLMHGMRSSYQDISMDYIQISSQWLLCIEEAIEFNRLLDYPLVQPPMGKCFNGTFFEACMAGVDRGTQVAVIMQEIEGGRLYSDIMRVLSLA
nr:protein asteroid homolog 1-like [Ciona intestinalis]|eukprot:XP_002130091.2 protein asteroid homolog 1-like [Ciona intestinalis]